MVKFINAISFLSILILGTAYGAAFYSLLTLPQFEPPIDSLADLFKLIVTNQRTVVSYAKNPNNGRYFNISTNPSNVFYLLGLHFQRTNKKFYSLERVIEEVEKNPQNVAIATRVTLAAERYQKARLPLHIASVSFEPDIIGWIAEKGSPLIAPINRV